MEAFDKNLFNEINKNLRKYREGKVQRGEVLEKHWETLGLAYLEKNISSIKEELINKSKMGKDKITIIPIDDDLFDSSRDRFEERERKCLVNAIVEILLRKVDVYAYSEDSYLNGIKSGDYNKIVINAVKFSNKPHFNPLG